MPPGCALPEPGHYANALSPSQFPGDVVLSDQSTYENITVRYFERFKRMALTIHIPNKLILKQKFILNDARMRYTCQLVQKRPFNWCHFCFVIPYTEKVSFKKRQYNFKPPNEEHPESNVISNNFCRNATSTWHLIWRLGYTHIELGSCLEHCF